MNATQLKKQQILVQHPRMIAKMWPVLKAFVNMVVSVLPFIIDPNASVLLDSLVLDVKSTLMNVPPHLVLMVVLALTYPKVTGNKSWLKIE